MIAERPSRPSIGLVLSGIPDLCWVGAPYQISVDRGLSPLQWLNKLINTCFVGDIVFASDGRVRRPGDGRTLSVAKRDLHWRWDAVKERILIDFMSGGSPTNWRWDELRSVASTSSDGDLPNWTGIAHVGNTTYTYSLRARSSETPSSSARESLLALNGSVDCTAGTTFLSGMLPGIAMQYNQELETEEQRLQQALAAIDVMWLQEQAIQSRAELYNLVLDTTVEVERGVDAQQAIRELRGRMDELKGWLLESLHIRRDARASISLNCTFEEIETFLANDFDGTLATIEGSLEQILHPECIANVAITMREMISDLAEDFRLISRTKEENMDQLDGLDHALTDLRHREQTFLAGVLAAARANAENLGLQRGGLKTVLGTLSGFWSRQAGSSNSCLDSSVVDDCLHFVLDVMRQNIQDTTAQGDACLVLEELAKHGPTYAEEVTTLGGTACIVQAMRKHIAHGTVQANGCSALLALSLSSASNKSAIVSHGGIEVVLEAIVHHSTTEPKVEKGGHQLLGILVWAGAVSAALCSIV